MDTRCGLRCAGCGFKESHGCGGCIATNGHPFHGECPIAVCCQDRGLTHCGECDEIPCELLYSYAYLDPEHGDKPQGARVEVCRRWAAERGIRRWENVLLTDAGFYNPHDLNQPLTAIIDRFAQMLGKPFGEAKVLFIPTAAQDDEARQVAAILKEQLLSIGVAPGNIAVYDIDGALTEDQAMAFDAIYFTGGRDSHLLNRVRQTGFDRIVKRMVYANKVYVGQSAGSIIATPNIRGCFGGAYNRETAGLCLVNAYIDAHCNFKPDLKGQDLPLPHIMLRDHQALAVSWAGYELVEETGARQAGGWARPPKFGKDAFDAGPGAAQSR
ncbi:MAG: type 1 glutamine amidotransferase-like domain-containing protein [Clostridiales bacterium]|nr:type 1 glutamine amidotransferase-like domain-containing protein [Clostridiales bacterium]